MPRYKSITDYETLTDFPVMINGRKETCILKSSYIEAKSEKGIKHVPVYFLDNYQYFDRDRLYAYDDEGERFSFFQHAAISAVEHLGFMPDVVHCNDWQTGFLPFLIGLRSRQNPAWKRVGTCYTIHNLRYQGDFHPSVLRYLNIGTEHFHPEGFEYYGKVNFMKAGIVYSDVVNTVSESYSREIQTAEFGEGLDGVLRRRGHDLYGIVNGINYHEFNPKTDPRIFSNYDSQNLSKRVDNKHALQRELNLPVSCAPLIGVVTRLVDQKGLDILLEAMDRILREKCQFVLLGTGDKFFEDGFAELSRKHPEQTAVVIGFNGVLAQKIYAGSDLFLMPSKFEPCGLGQLIAMRYGSIPVVRKTGGLADTVLDYDNETGSGNGFVFSPYTAQALADATIRGLRVHQDANRWQKLVTDTMERDFSWNKQAALYTELYLEALGRKGREERPA